VAIHFLLSMVLLWVSAELVLVSGERYRRRRLARSDRFSAAIVGLAAVVLVADTLVTGTGPNSGDAVADRLDFELESITRVHTSLVWLMVATIVATAITRRDRDTDRRPALQRLMVATVIQGAIGYLQYALGLPPGIVALHILGAMAVWWSALWFHLSDVATTPEPARSDPTPMETAA